MKQLFLRTCLSVVALFMAASSFAYDFEVDGIYYDINSDGKTVSVTFKDENYYSYFNAVEIPSSVIYAGETYPVTNIGNYAFYFSTIRSIFIPSSVVSIGQFAFAGCIYLNSISIPSSVVSIDKAAFMWTDNLEKVEFSSIESLCKTTFADGGSNPLNTMQFPSLFINGTEVTSLEIPSSITSIGDYAFIGWKGLSSLNIPSSVTSIGKWAFAGCDGLTSIEIPSSVTTIGKYAFGTSENISIEIYCHALLEEMETFDCFSSITEGSNVHVALPLYKRIMLSDLDDNIKSMMSLIPESVTAGVHFDVDGITYQVNENLISVAVKTYDNSINIYEGSITIPEKVCYGGLTFAVTQIGYSAFKRCSGLTSIEIPSSVTEIGEFAFEYCSGLTSIEIPSSVTVIGKGAFYGCSGLTSIEIPSSVTEIGERAFYNCSELTSIKVDAANTVFDSRDNCNAIIRTGSNELIVGCQNTVIPSSVTSIGKEAFYKCSSLTSIEIPSSVTSIGERAFWGCSGLTSIEIPSSVTSIGYGAFSRCKFSWMLLNSAVGVDRNSLGSMTCKTVFVNNEEDKRNLSNYYNGKIAVLSLQELPFMSIKSFICGAQVDFHYLPLSDERREELFGTTDIPVIKDLVVYKGNENVGEYDLNDNNSCLVEGLDPDTGYTIKYVWQLNDEEATMEETFQTVSPGAFSANYSSTPTTLTITEITAPSDTTAVIKEVGFIFDGKTYPWNEEPVTLTGLVPDSTYIFSYYAEYENGKNFSISYPRLSTSKLEPRIVDVTVTPTTFSCCAEYDYDGEIPYDGEGRFTITYRTLHDINTRYAAIKATSSSCEAIGLMGNTNYDVVYEIGGGKAYYSFKTPDLTITTLTPKVIRKGEVILRAETNADDSETNMKIHWWPKGEMMAGGELDGIIHDGQIEASLKGLEEGVCYIVYPMYNGPEGSGYDPSGELVEFYADSPSFYEPTVYTYSNVVVDDNSVMLSGVSFEGTDDILEQGFEYWISDDYEVKGLRGAPATGIQKVLATGERMSVELTGLDAGTTYGYRAFATTASGTTYGDERTFTTTGEKANAIEDVLVGGSQQGGEPTEVARYNLNGVRIATPQHGVNIIRMSDGTTRKVLVK